MKPSIFNTFLPLSGGDYLLFNTLSGTIVTVDEEMKSSLENEAGESGNIDGDSLEKLRELGVVRGEDFDERAFFEYKFQEKKFSTRDVQVSVLLTYACNLSCSYCYEGRGEVISKSMDKETSEKVIKCIMQTVNDSGCRNLGLTLYGGEPLLNYKQGLKILERLSLYCKERDVRFKAALISNGTLIDRRIAGLFSPYLNAVQLTLDGPRWYHDEKRVRKDLTGTYDRIMESVSILKESGIPVFLRIQISKDNLGLLDELFEELKSRGFGSDPLIKPYVFPLMNIGEAGCLPGSECIPDDDYAEILPEVWEKAAGYGLSLVSKPVPTYIQPFCSFFNNYSYIIDPYGDIYKCVSLVGKKEHKAAYIDEGGRIAGQTYEMIEFMSRNPARIEKCRDCPYLPTCSGGCAFKAYSGNESFQSGDCSLHKSLEERKILAYLKYSQPGFQGDGDE
jgi:uncharacterized protein